MTKKATECMTPGCHRNKFSRKLCQKCRTSLQTRISRGELTDDEAVERGLIAPKETAGRKPTEPMSKALARTRTAGK